MTPRPLRVFLCEHIQNVGCVLDAARVERGVRLPIREHALEGVGAFWRQSVLALLPPLQRLGRVGLAGVCLQPLALGGVRAAEQWVHGGPSVFVGLRSGGLAVARWGRLMPVAMHVDVPACPIVLEIRCPAAQLLELGEGLRVFVSFVAGVGLGPLLLGVVPEDRDALIWSDWWQG